MSNEPTSNVTEEARYQVPAAVVREALSGDELVVLDSQSHRFYSLNSTGKRIYELAAEGLPAAAIAERIAEEFEAPPAECLSDVVALLDDLVTRGLLARTA